MREHNYTEKIRQQLMRLGGNGQPVEVQELALELDLIGDREKRPLYKRIEDMVRRGEVERVAPGVLVYRGKSEPAEIYSTMWKVIRMRKVIGIDDLQSLTGASRAYSKEYLQMLTRSGIIQRIDAPKNQPAKYRMIHDPGPTPVKNTENAERMRRVRESQIE